jgi:F-type H+-transporting ATPase subunit b
MFIVLLAVLRKYALGPLVGVMEARQNKITNDISSAEKSRAEASKLLEEQKQALVAVRKDAQDVIESARLTADRQADEILRKAKEETEQFKKTAISDINREKEQALTSLREQVGALSVMLATKIIEKELDDKQQEKLVGDFLKEIGEAK